MKKHCYFVTFTAKEGRNEVSGYKGIAKINRPLNTYNVIL